MSEPYSGDWELIATYVAGRASPAERERVEERSRSDPEYRAQVAEARAAWEIGGRSFADPPRPADAERIWAQLMARIRAAEHPGTSRWLDLQAPTAPRSARGGWRAMPGRAQSLAIAAVVATILALSASWIIPRLAPPETRRLAASEIIAEPDRIRSVRLDDGTRVWLAPSSSLRVPSGFGAETREVSLVGRAFLAVEPDPDRPFVVHASGTETRVLGTEFEVRAYPDQPEVDVAVRSGRVAVRAAAAPEEAARILRRGDVATLGRDGRVTVQSLADLDAAFSWIHGHLVFDRTPLQEVAAELERWTRAEIRITDPSLYDLRLTAAFKGESIQEVLDVIARLLEVQVHHQGRQILISPRPDDSTAATNGNARRIPPQRTDP